MNRFSKIFLFSLFIVFIGSGCYTVIDPPINKINHSVSEPSNSNDIAQLESDIDMVSDEYIVINNYSCVHNDGYCGHDISHSLTDCHGCLSSSGHCHLSFNWWTGSYACNSYYCNMHHNHHYHSSWGHHHDHWWAHNNSYWGNSIGNHTENDHGGHDQVRRDRNFDRVGNSQTQSDVGSYGFIGNMPQSQKKIAETISSAKRKYASHSENQKKKKIIKKKKKKEYNQRAFNFITGLLSSSNKGSDKLSNKNSSKSKKDSYKSKKVKSSKKNKVREKSKIRGSR